MHMSDALVSPAVAGTMCAVSAGLAGVAVGRVRRHFVPERVPLMGVLGAFVFAAQMVNFAIPGTGSSGHITGAVLLAVLLGPCAGFIVLACVLAIQALFFADGGLLALGANLFNLGFWGCFFAYPLIFRPLAGPAPTRGRLMLASVVSVVIALQLGAFSVTLTTLLSGVTALPFAAFAAVMQPIHLVIGVIEGVATGLLLAYLYDVRPQLAAGVAVPPEERRLAPVGAAAVLLVAALALGGGWSLLASEKPDGLEWSVEKVAGAHDLDAPDTSAHALSERIQTATAVFPDYESSGGGGSGWAGLIGTAAVLAAAGLTGRLLARRGRATGE